MIREYWTVLSLLFTKSTMETVFPHMYVDPNLQEYHRAMSGRVGNRNGRRYCQKMVNSWLSAFIQVSQNSTDKIGGIIEWTQTNILRCGTYGLQHGCAKVAHCVPARWRNFSHYCRPLRQYDVWITCSEHREALTAAPTADGVHIQAIRVQWWSI